VRKKLTRVAIRDLFKRKDVELAKRMTRLAFQKKQDGMVCRFCVSNIHGVPVLLCAGQDQKYSEMDQKILQAKLDLRILCNPNFNWVQLYVSCVYMDGGRGLQRI